LYGITVIPYIYSMITTEVISIKAKKGLKDHIDKVAKKKNTNRNALIVETLKKVFRYKEE